jgi:copper transport protein
MAPRPRVTGALLLRRGVVCAVLVAVVTLLSPSPPASAHAELVSSAPAQGTRLDSFPEQIRLTFTESVTVVAGGLRLVDSDGRTVSRSPVLQGRTVRWYLPRLPDGAYVLDWRIVSSDGHPVSGAFSFGVGADVRSLPTPTGDATGGVPWPVAGVRFVGYLGFALVLGAVGFVTWCSREACRDVSVQLLARAGLVAGGTATVAALLVHGPYATGASWDRLLELELVRSTAATTLGAALLCRTALFAALCRGMWTLRALDSPTTRWLVTGEVLATAVTFSATGHGAASGRVVDIGVDVVHVLAAGTWVGGLAVLVVLGRAVEPRALRRFSGAALVSVAALVTSGVVSSLVHVQQVSQLWGTRYGQILCLKLVLVGAALAAAAVSRHRLHAHGTPLASVRVEAVVTAAVLAVTAVLTLTGPPASVAAQAASGGADVRRDDVSVTVQLDRGRLALVRLGSDGPTGRRLSVRVVDADRRALAVNRVGARLGLPARRIDGLELPLTRRGGTWSGPCQVPFPGTWRLTLTVEDRSLAAFVTAADLRVPR